MRGFRGAYDVTKTGHAVVAATLAVWAVVQRLVAAGRQQATSIRRHGGVGTRGPDASAREPQRMTLGPHNLAPAYQGRVHMADNGGLRHRLPGLVVSSDPADLGKRLLVDNLDEHVEEIPPHVRPTAKASASLTPYRWSTGTRSTSTRSDSS